MRGAAFLVAVLLPLGLAGAAPPASRDAPSPLTGVEGPTHGPSPRARAKRRAGVGRLAATVALGPEAGRAVLEATFAPAAAADRAEVVLVLPEGVRRVGGDAARVAADGEGRARWELEHPTDRAVDVVVRLTARVDGALRTTEAYARLDPSATWGRTPSSSAR